MPLGRGTFLLLTADHHKGGISVNKFGKMQERRDRLHENTERLAACFLEPSKDGKGWVCPCGHGSGTAKKRGQKNQGDGIKFDERGRWHCFSCGRKGDIIDLYQYKNGLDYSRAVDELETMLGFAPPVEAKPKAEKPKAVPKPEPKDETPPEQEDAPTTGERPIIVKLREAMAAYDLTEKQMFDKYNPKHTDRYGEVSSLSEWSDAFVEWLLKGMDKIAKILKK